MRYPAVKNHWIKWNYWKVPETWLASGSFSSTLANRKSWNSNAKLLSVLRFQARGKITSHQNLWFWLCPWWRTLPKANISAIIKVPYICFTYLSGLCHISIYSSISLNYDWICHSEWSYLRHEYFSQESSLDNFSQNRCFQQTHRFYLILIRPLHSCCSPGIWSNPFFFLIAIMQTSKSIDSASIYRQFQQMFSRI